MPNRHPWPRVKGIVATPGTCWGDPRFDGTRVPVSSVLGALAGGDSEETVMDSYGLTRADMKSLYNWLWACMHRARCWSEAPALQALNQAQREALLVWEQWEGELIEDRYPYGPVEVMSQELHDSFIKAQNVRNAVLHPKEYHERPER